MMTFLCGYQNLRRFLHHRRDAGARTWRRCVVAARESDGERRVAVVRKSKVGRRARLYHYRRCSTTPRHCGASPPPPRPAGELSGHVRRRGSRAARPVAGRARTRIAPRSPPVTRVPPATRRRGRSPWRTRRRLFRSTRPRTRRARRRPRRRPSPCHRPPAAPGSAARPPPRARAPGSSVAPRANVRAEWRRFYGSETCSFTIREER